MVAIKHI